ncbi:unnamed protein product [Urochloa humidicola]
MPRDESSPSKAIVVSSGLGNSTATTGRLPFPMLTRTNYAAWAMRMKFLLRANGAWGAVDRAKKPTTEAVDEVQDQLALSLISQSVDDDTLLRVSEKETAYDVWEALRSMHVGVERVREARVQSLRADLDNLKMSNTESVDDFAGKFMTLVGHIRELGDAVEEKYVVKKLLRSVSTKFINVASSMVLFGNINNMAMEEAIGSLKAHEELLKGQEVRSEEQLLMARGENSARGRGRAQGSRDGRQDKSKVKCYNCQDYGHFAWECPKKEKVEKALLAQGYGSEEPTLL